MPNQNSLTTRVEDYIKRVLPDAHGHQQKAVGAFVAALLVTQSCVQAALARYFDNFEAASRRLTRLLHNTALEPEALAQAHAAALVAQVPGSGVVRLMLDWTSEGTQHLLVASLLIGRRALPLYWRAYADGELKDRTKQLERAFTQTLIERVCAPLCRRRLLLLADRGFADVEFFAQLDDLGVAFIIRTKASLKVRWQGDWRRLETLRWAGNQRCRALGRLWYNASDPRRYFICQSRARNKKGAWGIWHLVSNRPLTAQLCAAEYARRMAGEQGFRDAKTLLGFRAAQVADLQAWTRLFTLVALALSLLYAVAMRWLAQPQWSAWLRQLTSRRRQRREVSLVHATLRLLFKEPLFLDWLTQPVNLNLEAHL
jgi:hypothetical protein